MLDIDESFGCGAVAQGVAAFFIRAQVWGHKAQVLGFILDKKQHLSIIALYMSWIYKYITIIAKCELWIKKIGCIAQP